MMATSARRERVSLLETCSNDNLKSIEGRQEARYTNRRQRSRRKWEIRSIGSSSLLLILTWEFIITCSLGLTLQTMQNMKMNLDPEQRYNPAALWVVEAKYVLGISALTCLTIPIVSLLAEVAIGRYKFVSFSLKAIWILSVIDTIVSLCGKNLHVENNAHYIFKLFILIPQYVLLGSFSASAVPLALDQITGGTDANISAFIQWHIWVFLSGIAIPPAIGSVFYNSTYLQTNEVSLIISLLSVLLPSVGLILDFYFHHKLVQEPVTVNPVSHIIKVLKYAAKHKYPVQRSAFAYCENEQPTRLDYGKSKYGGPFTTEQVEDVKTFFRVLVVILVISTSFLQLLTQIESVPDMEQSFGSLRSIPTYSHAIITPTFLTVFTIPLYELLIYPCLRKCRPTILQSAVIGATALIVSSVYGLTAESMRHIFANGTTGCLFAQNVSTASKTGILIAIPFNFMLGFATVVLPKSGIEFVCAQAPYNMKGLLVGLFYTIVTFFIVLGTLLYLAWSNTWFAILGTSTCGTWFYLTTLLLAVLSSALLGLVMRWYKRRERDETTTSQNLVEEVYHKYHKHSSVES